MPRLPRVTAAEIVRALGRDGWVVKRQAGSHAHLFHPQKPGRVTVPLHVGRIVRLKTLAAILDDAGVTVDRFMDLM